MSSSKRREKLRNPFGDSQKKGQDHSVKYCAWEVLKNYPQGLNVTQIAKEIQERGLKDFSEKKNAAGQVSGDLVRGKDVFWHDPERKLWWIRPLAPIPQRIATTAAAPRGKKSAQKKSGAKKGKSKAHGKTLVGCRVSVWWAGEDTFFEGVIDAYDASAERYRIIYDDGDADEAIQFRRHEVVKKGGRIELVRVLEHNLDDSEPSVGSEKPEADNAEQASQGNARNSEGPEASPKPDPAVPNKIEREQVLIPDSEPAEAQDTTTDDQKPATTPPRNSSLPSEPSQEVPGSSKEAGEPEEPSKPPVKGKKDQKDGAGVKRSSPTAEGSCGNGSVGDHDQQSKRRRPSEDEELPISLTKIPDDLPGPSEPPPAACVQTKQEESTKEGVQKSGATVKSGTKKSTRGPKKSRKRRRVHKDEEEEDDDDDSDDDDLDDPDHVVDLELSEGGSDFMEGLDGMPVRKSQRLMKKCSDSHSGDSEINRDGADVEESVPVEPTEPKEEETAIQIDVLGVIDKGCSSQGVMDKEDVPSRRPRGLILPIRPVVRKKRSTMNRRAMKCKVWGAGHLKIIREGYNDSSNAHQTDQSKPDDHEASPNKTTRKLEGKCSQTLPKTSPSGKITATLRKKDGMLAGGIVGLGKMERGSSIDMLDLTKGLFGNRLMEPLIGQLGDVGELMSRSQLSQELKSLKEEDDEDFHKDSEVSSAPLDDSANPASKTGEGNNAGTPASGPIQPTNNTEAVSAMNHEECSDRNADGCVEGKTGVSGECGKSGELKDGVCQCGNECDGIPEGTDCHTPRSVEMSDRNVEEGGCSGKADGRKGVGDSGESTDVNEAKCSEGFKDVNSETGGDNASPREDVSNVPGVPDPSTRSGNQERHDPDAECTSFDRNGCSGQDCVNSGSNEDVAAQPPGAQPSSSLPLGVLKWDQQTFNKPCPPPSCPVEELRKRFRDWPYQTFLPSESREDPPAVALDKRG